MTSTTAPSGTGSKRYTLLGADRRPYPSQTPGEFGGHRKNKIYGRLDCPTALRAIAAGGYVASRVFFADEPTAVAAGLPLRDLHARRPQGMERPSRQPNS